MTADEFYNSINKFIKVGLVLQNPAKGTSIIKSINNKAITYIRGRSSISIRIEEIYNVYLLFRGKRCSTNDLKCYKPRIFDSKCSGHSCNCTFSFMVLNKMGLVNKIEGYGKSGSPFYISIK